MTILIPTDSNDRFGSVIASIEENNSWAFVTLVEGQIDRCEFFERKEDIIEWIDYVVVLNEREYFWPFKEEGSKILTVTNQKSIDEIIESFLFKDLCEI